MTSKVICENSLTGIPKLTAITNEDCKKKNKTNVELECYDTKSIVSIS